MVNQRGFAVHDALGKVYFSAEYVADALVTQANPQYRQPVAEMLDNIV
jgi:hypothetical protein